MPTDSEQRTDSASPPSKSVGKSKSKDKITATLRAEVEKNSAALAELKGLPDKIDRLFELFETTTNDAAQPDVVALDDDESDKTINSLLSKSAEDEKADHSLKDILTAIQPETEYGDPISGDVSESVTKLFGQENFKATRERLKEKYKVPDNCKILGVPRINKEIWQLLPSKTRQRDFALQQQQQLISTASVAVTKLAEGLFTSKEPVNNTLRESLLRTSMEAVSVLAQARDDMNKQRKLQIKTVLHKEYASVCTTSKSSAELLFGEDIQDQLRAARNSANVVRTVMRHEQSSHRYLPYRQDSQRPLNYQGPPARGRGANFRQGRSRPYSRARFFSHHRNFQQ